MNRYETMADAELMLRLSQRDKNARSYIYDKYFAPLFSHAKNMLGSDTYAKDVVHDAFFSMLARKMRFLSERQLKAFLYTCVQNNIITQFHRKKRFQSHLQDVMQRSNISIDNQELDILYNNIVDEAIKEMPEKMGRIFKMSFKEYLDAKEIAERVGISEEGVKKHLYNGSLKLRAWIRMRFFLCLMLMILLLSK
ncbi:RNA polymerase sigma-70 factor, ECF subfamily [Chitinophaga sp. YR573]|uniref:RNA polymerase sigma factor n=1 Tax=Chitinophaga sp. YR573 TaxID=1881040 RepID=UPI0008B6C80E|nr:sigma-70 family RNA polymerase sigma factor [Chitinophaga sp. YR573]SEW38904.1 RNA polymerase sigma-70 factor, ECF subfamily [Chitinophaga sp. YR573]